MTSAARAVNDSAVAIFAYLDARGRPLACPVTPYIDEGEVVVTSTLAFLRKAVHVRRDPRVALLASHVEMRGEASIAADASGERFVDRFLDQEIRKYPPAEDIVRVPFARSLFWWFFGRVEMRFEPTLARPRSGDDAACLVTVDETGFPAIVPIEAPPPDAESFALRPLGPEEGLPPRTSQPATVLLHSEPTMSDLRQLLLRGRAQDGRFEITSRHGSLEAAPGGAWAEAQRHVGYHRRAWTSRSVLRRWAAEDQARSEALAKRVSSQPELAQ